ncbi:hypothetical protein RvY_08533 [Ramazzottius varieornatus]|uniref:SMP-LTD domain-containing protein n=1 Tax=Ramazzottius varieornatus TaxID=947166 RepID=A0A1D1V666_RAMVA|nr:hypothetical protein RvY_08533 [Ramazzottius varieornatus]
MMRRTKGSTAPAGSVDTPTSPSSFSVKFAAGKNADSDDDYVNIREDPILTDIKPNPPSSLSYKGGEFFATPKAPKRKPSPEDLSKVEMISPPSPDIGRNPTVEKSSSFRDNFHNLKERFSHRKNSEDDREKLLTPSAESVHSGTSSKGTKEPSGILGKITKKLEDRRGSASDKSKDSFLRSSSPMKDSPSLGHGGGGFYADIQKLPIITSPTLEHADALLRNAEARATNQILIGVRDSDSSRTNTVVRDVPELNGSRKGRAPSPPQPPPRVRHSMSKQEKEGDMKAPPAGNCPPVRIAEEKKDEGLDMMHSAFFSNTPLLLVGGLLVAILVVPMPSFMSGLLFGIIFTAAASVRIWFTLVFPSTARSKRSLPPTTPAIIPAEGTRYAKQYSSDPNKAGNTEPPSTWMNQMIGDFDIATFSVNQTQNVYVSLDGTDLRIRKTKNRVLPKRAMYDEELKSSSFTFTESRVFSIADAEVTLIPEDIPRKRRWIWRLPIGIKLVDPASVATYIEDLRAEAVKQDEEDKKKNKFDEKVSAKRLHWGDPPVLYLLPRSDREKEDWYWRFKRASGKYPMPEMKPNLSQNLSTLNVLLHRVAFDVLVDPIWRDVVKKKIQKKLSIIKLPFYIEELQITEMDLGKNLPIISNVSEKPGVDERGIWIEMDFEYHGTVQMTLQTKLNLMKLKKGDDETEAKHVGQENEVQMDTMSVGSVDSVYSSASSRDRAHQQDQERNMYESDEVDEFDEVASQAPEGGKQKLMRYVEKITESKAFQKLTDVKMIRKAMENVSDTDLAMTVVVERLAGRLAFNIAHPPSDKGWWGFTSEPDLHLRAFPKLGEREVTYNHVTDWIEKKMTTEFHRLITVPNMDDITIAIMNSMLDDPDFRLNKLSDLILK